MLHRIAKLCAQSRERKSTIVARDKARLEAVLLLGVARRRQGLGTTRDVNRHEYKVCITSSFRSEPDSGSCHLDIAAGA